MRAESDRERRATPAADHATDPTAELLAGLGLVTATLQAARLGTDAELDVPTAAQDTGSAASRLPVPVTLLAGPLGSGKTTALRVLLEGDHGLRITAVVNDIGPVSIDANALARTGAPVAGRVDLANGCACCDLADDLAATLRAAAGAVGADGPATTTGLVPDAIVVEASGAADAVAMAAVIEHEPSVRLDGIVGLVDAESWAEESGRGLTARLLDRLYEVAHVLVLTKTDRCDQLAVGEVEAEVARRAPGRRILRAEHGRIDPAVLLDPAAFGVALRSSEPGGGSADRNAHTPGLVTTAVALPEPVDARALTGWLDGDHGLLRAKGTLTLHPQGGVHELQMVGRRWTLSPLGTDHRARQATLAQQQDPVVVLIADTAVALTEAERVLRTLMTTPAAEV